MVVFPNAKINLGLNILSKREDGFHNISSCFYPVNFCDILEILPSNKLSFTSTGIEIPGDSQNNLCIKAYQLLKADFDIPPVHIHLHKIIPIGAGLGGGSSDASFTLKALNNLFELNLMNEQLEKYAGKLGSDCPFFISNKPVIASGTGSTFESIRLNLSAYRIELAYPEIHISTQEAYSGVIPKKAEFPINEIITRPLKDWRNPLKNDFEESISLKYPAVKQLKQKFYDEGAVYASMTGSGSAVYGIFDQPMKNHLSNSVWSGLLS